MTFERHRILSAEFVEAVERADGARADLLRRLLFFWRRRDRRRPGRAGGLRLVEDAAVHRSARR